MTFKGDTIIGKPTFAMIEIYIAEKGWYIDPRETYEYWEKRKWLNRKGIEMSTLENAISVYYRLYLNEEVKKREEEAKKEYIHHKQRRFAMRKARMSQKENFIPGNKGLDNLIKIEDFCLKPKREKKENITYDEQLKDKRWEAFRTFVFAVRGRKCEICGSTSYLQIHHPKYKSGHLAWEYTCNDVMVVCGGCHKKIHKIK